MNEFLRNQAVDEVLEIVESEGEVNLLIMSKELSGSQLKRANEETEDD